MKKIYSLLCTALLLMGLTACEDVPAPYEINEDGPTDNKVLLSETFASSLGKFQNITADGAIEWVNSYSCATATGYDNSTKTNTAGICYLVSPEVDLTEVDSAHVSYEYILQYRDKDEYQKLLIIDSDNYNAAEIENCSWTTVFATHEQAQPKDYTTFYKADVNVPDSFYGKKVRLALRFQAGAKSATWEVKNFKVQRGVAGSDNPTPGPADDPKGTGTATDPYNIAAVLKLFADNNIPTSEIYFKGIVSKVKEVNPDYGNATYYVSDDGKSGNDFYVYRSKYLNGEKFTNANQILVGDTVIVCGKVTLYNTTPETEQNASYLYWTSNNGVTPTPPGPDVDVKAVTIAEFNSLPVGDTYYQLTGTVSGIKSGDVYGNFDLTDETGTVYVYGLLSEKGGAKKQFQELAAAKGISDGCTLTLIGKRGDYQGKIEVMDAYFVSASGGTTPTPPGPTPDPVSLEDFKNGDFETWANGLPTYWKTASTAGNATLAQSTDAHSGSYSVLVKTGGSANKRLGYQEMTLAAGKYAISFYAKGAEGNDAASVRPGYVPIKDDGSVGSYAYGEYTNNITSSQWVQVTHTFELTATTTICLVIMNPKNCGDVLIDDFTIGTVSSAKKRK